MKKEGVWYTLFVNAMGIAWNTTKVTPEEEKLIREGGWNVLTDPRWKGRIATGTPASGGSSYSYVYMFLGGKRDQLGPDFIAKMAALKPQVYESKSPMYDRLAAGRACHRRSGLPERHGRLLPEGSASPLGLPEADPGQPDGPDDLRQGSTPERRAPVPGMGHESRRAGRMVQGRERRVRPSRHRRSPQGREGRLVQGALVRGSRKNSTSTI